MRIATWNINSIRIRLPLVLRYIQDHAPDVICFQETKVDDSIFPARALRDMGYDHVSFCGQKAYNGVAILSKAPLHTSERLKLGGNNDCRHISVVLPNGVELHNFYVPAGGDEPDLVINPKYVHKLRYVEEMSNWFDQKRKSSDRMLLVGDLNIAPLEHDVWSHKQLLNVVSHTPPETERMAALQQSLSWVDSGRHFVPADQKLYSWWSYRNGDWQKSNRGRRLDHIWATPALQDNLKAYTTATETRAWPQPSDHVPVMLDLVG